MLTFATHFENQQVVLVQWDLAPRQIE